MEQSTDVYRWPCATVSNITPALNFCDNGQNKQGMFPMRLLYLRAAMVVGTVQTVKMTYRLYKHDTDSPPMLLRLRLYQVLVHQSHSDDVEIVARHVRGPLHYLLSLLCPTNVVATHASATADGRASPVHLINNRWTKNKSKCNPMNHPVA